MHSTKSYWKMLSETKYKGSSMYTIKEASRCLNMTMSIIEKNIDMGMINAEDNMISGEEIERIKKQKEKYVSLFEISNLQNNNKFDGKYICNRNKYLDYLEKHNFFGVETYDSKVSPNGIDKEVFFLRSEIDYIIQQSSGFFLRFGFTDEELLEQILGLPEADSNTIWSVKRYLKEKELFGSKITPSVVNFVEVIVCGGNIKEIKNEDIIQLLEIADTKYTQNLILDFFNYTRKYEDVQYGILSKKQKESQSIQAYEYNRYARIVELIFSRDNDSRLISMAIEDSFKAEQWLFLALHFVCGWRALDICNFWIYPCLKDNNKFGIDMKNLKEDILFDNIKESTYISMMNYILKKIELSNYFPGKTLETNGGTLAVIMSDELKIFFGRLVLLAEYHHYNNGEGYMKRNRCRMYCNWVRCVDFFGPEYIDILGENNIMTRKLNKCYLQGFEKVSRKTGNTPMVSHILASIARNHSNVGTTSIYLKDHQLTGENANIVLSMMLDRGVLSCYAYNILLTAFPDAFEKLPAKHQGELINRMKLSAYDYEVIGLGYEAQLNLSNALEEENVDEATRILKAMYEIGNYNGKAKSKGICCLRTAMGYICEFPPDDCLANLCPNHIFTSQGIYTLIDTIKMYLKKYEDTQNDKYIYILNSKIIPTYKNVLNGLKQSMKTEDYDMLKIKMEELLK